MNSYKLLAGIFRQCLRNSVAGIYALKLGDKPRALTSRKPVELCETAEIVATNVEEETRAAKFSLNLLLNLTQ